MADHRPRVRVTQPDGGMFDARLRWWYLDEDDQEWALVEYGGWVNGQPYTHPMRVPSTSVELLDGVDYKPVETRRAADTQPSPRPRATRPTATDVHADTARRRVGDALG